MATTDTVTRYVGFCAGCLHDWKVVQTAEGDLVLAHHGYKRPGDGHIRGDCPGARRDPHELSPAVAQSMLNGIQNRLAQLREDLRQLPTVTQLRYRGRPMRNRETGESVDTWLTVWSDGRGDGNPNDYYTRTWQQVYDGVEYEIQSGITWFERDERTYLGLVTDWHPQPLREFEELVERKRAAEEERRAVREQKHQEQQRSRQAREREHQERDLLRRQKEQAAHERERVRDQKRVDEDRRHEASRAAVMPALRQRVGQAIVALVKETDPARARNAAIHLVEVYEAVTEDLLKVYTTPKLRRDFWYPMVLSARKYLDLDSVWRALGLEPQPVSSRWVDETYPLG